MNNWKEYKLGEVIELVGGGTPNTSISEYWNGEIPWLSVVDFNTGNKYVYKTEKAITQKGLENSSTRLLEPGDIIFSARGTVGAIAVLKDTMAFNQSCYGIKNIPEITDKDFLYYLIKSSVIKFQQIAHGGVFDTITRETFNNIDIILPSLPEQKAIASVLSSLDDKIDLLHLQNKTLEGILDLIFREWFLNNMYETFECKSLDEIATFQNGVACQKYPPHNEFAKLPVLKIKELQNGFSYATEYASTEVPNDYIIKNGDVIFSWSGSLAVKIWDGEDCILNQHLFKVSSEHYPKWFYYLWTKYYLNEFIAIAESKSTTMGHIKREDLSKAMVMIPTKSELKNKDTIMSPLINKIIFNNKQLIVLYKLKTVLVPNLMNGNVQIDF